jgi:5'-methylthioadenosine nucleosidase
MRLAMQAEAMPLVQTLNLTEEEEPSIFPKALPWKKYSGTHEGLTVHVVVPGKDLKLGVDSVGTVPVSMLTYASIVSLHPDLIINAGTAGGFRAKGAAIGDVFVATQFANHDRRIPVPVFDEYGIGTLAATPIPNLVKALELKEGKLSTGNSLDMTPQDEEIIKANDATIKDMEVSSNITCMHLSLSSCVQAGIANILTGNLFLGTSLIILGGATALCLV